jgi:hypothetical protein
VENTAPNTVLRDLRDRPLDEVALSDVHLVLRRVMPQDDTPVLEVAAFNSSI